MSVIFSWDKRDAQDLLATCERDEVRPLIEKRIPRGTRVLESGCGLARYVRYLKDRGWRTVGLEYSADTVAAVKSVWPDLDVVQGDVARSPFRDGAFDAVLSLGVVEHFVEGPAQPLSEIRRVLKPGGVAIITVPCLNAIRRLKRLLWWTEIAAAPRALAGRIVKGKPKPLTRLGRSYRYAVFPPYGAFHEYRMTTGEFAQNVLDAGLVVCEHGPIGMMDGLYHELNPFKLLLRFKHWQFHGCRTAYCLNRCLSKHPFLHSHMQVIVAERRDAVSSALITGSYRGSGG